MYLIKVENAALRLELAAAYRQMKHLEQQLQASNCEALPLLTPLPPPPPLAPLAPLAPSSAPPPRPPQPRHHARPSFAEQHLYRRSFIFRGHPNFLIPHGPALGDQLSAFFPEHLPQASGLAISNAFLMGDQTRRTQIAFMVGDLEEADAIIRWRHLLKGSPYSLYEYLSPEELLERRTLWPLYSTALSQGQRAQFSRSRLKIDGMVIRVS
jgi:hypothetical protein